MDDSARLVELETRLAYQDRTIEALNEVALELRREIDALRRDLAKLEERIASGENEVGPADEPPPHW